jgi:hypothetical protein
VPELSASLLVLALAGGFVVLLVLRAGRDHRAAARLREFLGQRGMAPVEPRARVLLEARGLWSEDAQQRLELEWHDSAGRFGLDGRLLRAEDELRWLASQSPFAWSTMDAMQDRIRGAFLMDQDRVAFMLARAARCSACRYDLSGLRTPRCPECGRFLVDHPRTWGEACLILASAYR